MSRLWWMLVRRHMLALRLRGFTASMWSHADARCNLTEYNRLHAGAVIINSTLGRFTYVSRARVANTTLGAFCSVGPEAMVGGLGRHPTTWISAHPAFYSTLGQVTHSFVTENLFDELPRVEIGNDVWIGARAIVLDGTKVGDGAIIAAGAVVAGNVAPYAIVGGVPARVIRTRFEQEQIDALVQLRWWEWPVDTLRELAPAFQSGDVSALIARAGAST